jgi:pimeloyl-ACP methyl ester carboxylesterase
MHVIFIGGLADKSMGIVKNYQNEFAFEYSKYSSEYFQWHEKKELIVRIKSIKEGFHKKIVLIGHSYGGATATQVLKQIEVDLLITIDPVCRIWSKDTPKVKRWININAIPKKYNISDYIALLGGKWGKSVKKRADEYYDVESNHGSFWKMMEKILDKEF